MLKKLLIALPLGLSLNAAADINSYAGLSLGISDTDRFDDSGAYFKLYAGSQVTSFLNLEFGFHHFGELKQDEPTRLDPVNGSAGGFSNAGFGSINSVSKDLYGADGTDENYNQFSGNLSSSPMGLSFALMPFYEVTPGLEVFIKVGALAWWAELEDLTLDGFNSAGGKGERSTKTRNIDTLDDFIGAGITYQIMPEFSVRGEFEQFKLSETTFQKTKLNIYSLSANYHF